MKTLALLKNEVMDFTVQKWLLFMCVLFAGTYGFFNAPQFILHMGNIFSFLQKTGELLWGMLSAFLMGVVGILAIKVGTQVWEDRLKLLFEKWFKKKEKK